MIKVTTTPPETFGGDLVVYGVFAQDKKTPRCQSTVRKLVRSLWKKKKFRADKGETLILYPDLMAEKDRPVRAGALMLIGMGTLERDRDGQREQLRLCGGTIASQARAAGAHKVLVTVPETGDLSAADTGEALSEGIVLGNYRFDRYQTNKEKKKKNRPVKSFLLAVSKSAGSVRRGSRRGENAALAACRARDMANEPGNVWTPARFAAYGRSLARKHRHLKCRVLDRQAMKKLGMGGILAVNQGSETPPALVIVEYMVDRKKPTLMLVGKGLTFDSGGVSIKPAAGMEEMKYDMCGGAAVLAAMEAVAREKPRGLNVVALVPSTDNMAGGGALKPGDIITHYGGKTSEIINTDAEGRLILADALAYGIDRYRPEAVVDLATLTGAVIIGLGHHRTGLLANDDRLAKRLIAAGNQCGEPFWRLPLGPEYSRQIESEIADIKNTGGRPAGTCTAAAYLQEFVGDTPWAHCDIAGTAWNFTEKSYVPKGPSGIGVRSLVTLIRQWRPLTGEQPGKS